MSDRRKVCPDCESDSSPVSRRDFIRVTSAGAAAAAVASPSRCGCR